VDGWYQSNYFLVQTIFGAAKGHGDEVYLGMLTAAADKTVSASENRVSDDARVLSLAETVGNMGHWYWHIQADSLSWSEQVFAIYGQDFLSFQPTYDRFVDTIHGADRDRVQANLETAVCNATSFECDARIIRPDGQIRNIITKAQPECDDDGQVVGLFGVVTDVTDAFRTLQAVRDQKDMLDLAARVSGLGHWVWDPDQACIAFCSDHLAHMFETGTRALVRSINHPGDFSVYLHPEDREAYASAVSEGVTAGQAYEVAYRRQTNAGERHFREIGQPILDGNGALQRYIATIQDVTDAKAREAELEKARQDLEASVQAKDQLFSIIGHDLKSPFNNIIGFASLLSSDDVVLGEEKMKEYAGLIVEAAENTHALLDTLLAWAAVESADLHFHAVDLDVADAVDESVRPLAVLAREKGVSITHKVGGIKVRADRDMVLTVFRNLINNSIKFCESGDHVTVAADVDENASEHIHITVSDNGAGMDTERTQAFMRSKRLPTAPGTEGETGSGLGLRLCLNLVSRHGGDLWVESVQGQGSTVHFTLPRC
jgi:signal transduction histidine kinase